jgi:hypothetical protein
MGETKKIKAADIDTGKVSGYCCAEIYLDEFASVPVETIRNITEAQAELIKKLLERTGSKVKITKWRQVIAEERNSGL